MPFSSAMQAAVTRINKCLRVYLKLTTCDGQELYIRSHRDIATPAGLTSEAEIAQIDGSSQRVDFETSDTTIGTFSFRILDFDYAFTKWLKELQKCSLGGARVAIYIGYEGVQCDAYYCAGTYLITGMKNKYKGYDFSAKDTQSLGNNDLFLEQCFGQFGDLYQTGSTLPTGDQANERQGFIARYQDEILEDGSYGELWFPGDANNRFTFINASEDDPALNSPLNSNTGYIKKDCEIMKVQWIGGQELDGTGAVLDNVGNVTVAATQGLSVNQYRIIERGAFGSKICEADNDGKVVSDGEKFCVAPYIAGSAKWVLYAIMTGLDYNNPDADFILPNNNRTAFAHAQIPPELIDKDCLEQFTGDLEFICPPEYKAKAFWQEQILRWLDAYFLIDCEGKMCLTPHELPDLSSADRYIDRRDIIRCTALEEDLDVTTMLFVSWDYDPCDESFKGTTGIALEAEVMSCFPRKQDICQFIGVRSTIDNGQSIINRMCNRTQRNGTPKWRTTMTLCIEHADLMPGQKIKVRNGVQLDYMGEDLFLDRVFEISSKRIEWTRGTVDLELIAPTKEPVDLEQCYQFREPCGANHCRGREDLAIYVPGYVVPAGTTTQIPAGDYCVRGDLVIDGTLKQNTPGTLNILATGTITVNGKIDTVGMGETGHQPGSGTADRTSEYYGRNQGQGSRWGLCQSGSGSLQDEQTFGGGGDNTGGGAPGFTDPDPNPPGSGAL